MDNGRYRSSSTWNTPRPAKKKVQTRPVKVARSGAVDFGAAKTRTRQKSTYDYDNFDDYMSESVESAQIKEEEITQPTRSKRTKIDQESSPAKAPTRSKKQHAIVKTIFWLLVLGGFATALVFLALEIAKTINAEGLTGFSRNHILTITSISFGISLIIIYLIMSHLSRKSAKETFRNFDKFTIYILANVILTVGIAFVSCVIIAQVLPGKIAEDNSGQNTLSYQSITTINEDFTLNSGSLISEKSDENVVNVYGDIVANLSNLEITKSGNTIDTDQNSKYGFNAAIIARNHATANLNQIAINTNGLGANGILALGSQSNINIAESNIATAAEASNGLIAKNEAVIVSSNTNVKTSGEESPAVAIEDAGRIYIDGGEYLTQGLKSPAVYLSGDISIKNAKLTAEQSEGIIVNGVSSASFENVELLSNSMTTENGADSINVTQIGTARQGLSKFSFTNSKLVNRAGNLFYFVGELVELSLFNNEIVNDEGGRLINMDNTDATIKMDGQNASGDINGDSESNIKIDIIDGSNYTGSINQENLAKSVKVYLDNGSTFTLSGDTYVSELVDDLTDYSNINFNGFTLYVNGSPIN